MPYRFESEGAEQRDDREMARLFAPLRRVHPPIEVWKLANQTVERAPEAGVWWRSWRGVAAAGLAAAALWLLVGIEWRETTNDPASDDGTLVSTPQDATGPMDASVQLYAEGMYVPGFGVVYRSAVAGASSSGAGMSAFDRRTHEDEL